MERSKQGKKAAASLDIRWAIVLLVAGLAMLILAGCQRVQYTPKQEAKYFKPTVAVLSFENMAPAGSKWQLGEGLADQLINRLIQTHRYVVLERGQLSSTLEERSGRRGRSGGLTAAANTAGNRLTDIRYLIKGTITDFGHVEAQRGIFRPHEWGPLGDSGYALVAATMYVIDWQTGQVMASFDVQGKVRDDKTKVDVEQNAFGGATFYQTSLGKATSEMLDKAVNEIIRTIVDKPYQPKIASVINNQVVINGGEDRNIEVGDEFVVRPPSQRVIDPDTGEVLGHIAGEILGRVRVIQVTKKNAIARIVSGNQFEPGETLFPGGRDNAKNPTAISSY